MSVASRPLLLFLRRFEEVAEGYLVIKGRFFLEGQDLRLLDDSFDESAFGVFDEPLMLDLGGPEAFGLGADGIGRVDGNAIVVIIATGQDRKSVVSL